MKKLIPLILVVSLVLSGCNLFRTPNGEKPLTDAEMATRVADILSTMTTPTVEMVFPATATFSIPVLEFTPTPQPTAETPVVEGTGLSTTPAPTATVQVTVDATTPDATTPEPTITVMPSPTVTPPPGDPAIRLGSPTGSDAMDSYVNWSWPTGSDSFLEVAFGNGYMEMTGLTTMAGWRLPLTMQQINTYIELTANSGTCKGKDSYGIIFRVPVFREPEQGYLYEVTCDGYYRLWKWDGKVKPNGQATSLLNWKQSDAIRAGADQTNRLGVLSVGNKITLYMNGEKLGEAQDSSYGAGFFGVFVLSRISDEYKVKFDAMKYWENPAP
jgi:hypothetical protein